MMKVFSFATSKTAKIMELEVSGGSLTNSSVTLNSNNSLNNSSYMTKETVEEEHAATKEEYVELFLSTLFVLNYRRQQRAAFQTKKGNFTSGSFYFIRLNELQQNLCNIKWSNRSTRKKCQKWHVAGVTLRSSRVRESIDYLVVLIWKCPQRTVRCTFGVEIIPLNWVSDTQNTSMSQHSPKMF